MNAAAEIAALRRQERLLDDENTRLGRLQNALLSAHPGDLRLCPFLPYGTWAELPSDWHLRKELRLTPRNGLPPRDIKGPVGVSLVTAEWIVAK